MGWLGWPPDTALDTPMPLVALALRGRMKMQQQQLQMLQRLFGGTPEPQDIDHDKVARDISRVFDGFEADPDKNEG
ncbi:MAG: hypothetical protein AAF942_00060 [Pseudomonadota bacterium]